MDEQKRRKLEAKGWSVGSAQDFLGLTAEESAFIDLKLALTRAFRAQRASAGLTQQEVARRMGSSQSRVAKIEGADPSISLDLIVRGLLATGASSADLAQAIDPGRGE